MSPVNPKKTESMPTKLWREDMQVWDDDDDDDDDDDCSTKLQQNRAFRTNVIRNIFPISEI